MRELLLLSGGIDSAALAAWRKPVAAVVIDYGQLPAEGEIRAATQVASDLGLPITTLRADCHEIGSGLMAGADSGVASPSAEWWPFRNQLLITLAAAWAVVRGYEAVLLGSVKGDGFHVDGTASFYALMDEIVRRQEGGLRVLAPAVELASAELIERSGIEDRTLAWTISCHRGSSACGDCGGCRKHEETLKLSRRLQYRV
jgi:7-cyano-7-deazaguanine synthase